MVLMVLSHTHLMVCYLPTYLPTYPSKFTLFIVQFMGRAASSCRLGKDGWREFPSLALWHRGGQKGQYRPTELSIHCLLLSLVIIPQWSGFVFSTVDLLLDENLFKESAKKK